MALGGNSPKQMVGRSAGVDPHGNYSNDGRIGDHQLSVPETPTLNLWISVGDNIDKSQQVVWKNAVTSLEEAHRFLQNSKDARFFVERYMKSVISILLEQQPSKIGNFEKSCVEDSLRSAVMIIAEDLRLKQQAGTGECVLLDVLGMIFNRKKMFYKGAKANWNVNLAGMPEVRQQTINKFQSKRGFYYLISYMQSRTNSNEFPTTDFLHQILTAVTDIIPMQFNNNNQETLMSKNKMIEEEAISLARVVMQYISTSSEDALKRQAHESLNTVRFDTQRIFEKLSHTRRQDVNEFYEFWRDLTLKLIKSESLPLRLFGWDQVNDLIDASGDMRPPPHYYVVEGAGHEFVNGKYTYVGQLTEDGYHKSGNEISYILKIPDNVPEKDGGGKTLTLFRCTMRSHQKWWFLSEADEEQPGTDKDIDYYQHKSKTHEEAEPPSHGWTTCKGSLDPPPTLTPSGLMVPNGEEYNTLEHQLARWAIQNNVIELVLGQSVHREVVARSTSLIRFLASMCERDEPMPILSSNEIMMSPSTSLTKPLVPNAFCLKLEHLLLAWKTCTSKTDAAVSAEIYQQLVSILPSLPNTLAIPLLSAIQESLSKSSNKKDYLFEVGEFCSALASINEGNDMDNNNNNSSNNHHHHHHHHHHHQGNNSNNSNNAVAAPVVLSNEIKAEVLKLMWEILTHPEASALKIYDRIKYFVTNELKLEPFGKKHREVFLNSCKQNLQKFAEPSMSNPGVVVDEVLALRMVKLTHFLLEACSYDHVTALVAADNAHLPNLLYKELVAYLERKVSELNKCMTGHEGIGTTELSERLYILRYVYALSGRGKMTTDQLDKLWSICVEPTNREALMIFLAKASNDVHYNNSNNNNNNNKTNSNISTVTEDSVVIQPHPQPLPQPQQQAQQQQQQRKESAFSEQVCFYVFQNLFCAPNLDWEHLGENAYQSFQMLFKITRRGGGSHKQFNSFALDALWRICLNAGNDIVASQAMKDLLSVYISISSPPAPMSYSQSLTFSMQQSNNASNSSTAPITGTAASAASTNKVADYDYSFGKRVFQCLEQIRNDLQTGKASSARSAERCLRILNSAVGQKSHVALSTTAATSTATSTTISNNGANSCAKILQNVPHGLRGKSSYRTVSVNLKRVPSSSLSSQSQKKFQDSFLLDVHPLDTVDSLKVKVAQVCKHPQDLVKPITLSNVGGGVEKLNLNSNPNVFEDSTMAQLGVVDGSELTVILAQNPFPSNSNPSSSGRLHKESVNLLDLSEIISVDETNESANRFFDTLLAVLEALPTTDTSSLSNSSNSNSNSNNNSSSNTYDLVWDLLFAIPTNQAIVDKVLSLADCLDGEELNSDAMNIDKNEWSVPLESSFYRSVYFIQTIDSFLQPAPEVAKPADRPLMLTFSRSFRRGFIESGGFVALTKFFLSNHPHKRMGNAVSLYVLKNCLFCGEETDELGHKSLEFLENKQEFLHSMTLVVTEDRGVSDGTILNILAILRLLLSNNNNISFQAENFLMTLILWERRGISTEKRVRRCTQQLILTVPLLAQRAFPWLIRTLSNIDIASEGTHEFFSTLRKLVERSNDKMKELCDLAVAVCSKMSSFPTSSTSASVKLSNSVLCGCLEILRALIETGAGEVFRSCSIRIRLVDSTTPSWITSKDDMITTPQEDGALINIMSAIFDGFLSSPLGSTSHLCSGKDSRQLGFNVVAAAARCTEGGEGYIALTLRLKEIIEIAAPSLRHKWSHTDNNTNNNNNSATNSNNNNNNSNNTGLNPRLQQVSKYSGLRNQGCTCYMNSVLQQLFMMPGLRKNICTSLLPTSLRSSGSGSGALVGKKISLHWESGVSYEAMVEGFDETTGMHTIRYCPLTLTSSGENQQHPMQHHQQHHQHSHQHHPQQQHQQSQHQQQQQQPLRNADDLSMLPEELLEEFYLSEGRPGKETGVFDVLPSEDMDILNDSNPTLPAITKKDADIEETEDEVYSRRLLEEVQRTFVHLEECSKGRCFDPRSLVEASGCLKLEFDVWQQNDASEFAMKLLDRLEISLKKWAPENFKYLEHAFRLRQTKQKICKECGLKSNREENLMNIDCQIRGKSDIHEALSTMCEVELMEGTNKVFCDRCKKNCDTVLRTAISNLPNVLMLSLKRFDLDYNTFETIKLNSRCAFGETLNMKRYTLEGMAEMEQENNSEDDDRMVTTDEDKESEQRLTDEDYEYNLVGVLVHAGVAQGGHYYSFIKDRSQKNEGMWYRFDDEDVTEFNPASIEIECFGGKVKQEKKFLNGQVQIVESEQFANALMLFYEKVKPTNLDKECESSLDSTTTNTTAITKKYEMCSGYDVYQPDVQRSNNAHSWHMFLFDAEFQNFLKGILGLCLILPDNKMELSPTSSPTSVTPEWPTAVLQICLTYFFDILLHAPCVEEEWVEKLSSALHHDTVGAQWFVHELARRSATTSNNWLRVYTSVCTEEASRKAAVKVMSAGILASLPKEENLLQQWTESWKGSIDNSSLDEELVVVEEETKRPLLDTSNGSASAIGVLITHIGLLLEHVPRTWRYSNELYLLISNLAFSLEVRRALLVAQIPARLVCLALREKSPYSKLFPGASISQDVADACTRNETLQLPMENSPDLVSILEALGCLIGVPGGKRAELVVEGTSGKGRYTIHLSDQAREALTAVFHESKTTSEGMSQRDIENYMQRCGLDSTTLSPQKISTILSKYPTATTAAPDGIKMMRVLTLEGFLTFYRDTAQSNDSQVRSDLHVCGFRPDLSRRPLSYESVESVAHDVDVELKKDNRDGMIDSGLLSLNLHMLAYSACTPLAECILATAAHGKDTTKLIIDALKILCRAPSGWAGTETYNACLMIFKVLASIPDERQTDRIRMIMQSREKCSPHVESGVGLLTAAKEFSSTRVSQHYPMDFHYSVAVERYINAVKELLKLHKVDQWMSKNRELWGWMEPWFRPEGNQLQVRNDLSGRRDAPMHYNNNHHLSSVSEINPVLDYSDSDEARYDHISVQKAGEPAVNGTYISNDMCDGVVKYGKEGKWQGKDHVFSLFRCKLSNDTRRWYISIVPINQSPGTNKDLDFYSAPATGDEHETPPERNWTTVKSHGCDPTPIVSVMRYDMHEDEDECVGSVGVLEENNNNRMWNRQNDGHGHGHNNNNNNGNDDRGGGRELGYL